jgi:hypothetical protein
MRPRKRSARQNSCEQRDGKAGRPQLRVTPNIGSPSGTPTKQISLDEIYLQILRKADKCEGSTER